MESYDKIENFERFFNEATQLNEVTSELVIGIAFSRYMIKTFLLWSNKMENFAIG
jgi:hypothetical protein